MKDFAKGKAPLRHKLKLLIGFTLLKALQFKSNIKLTLFDGFPAECKPTQIFDYADTKEREKRSTVSKSLWERNIPFSSKETASVECKPTQIFDYADTKKREKQPAVSESMCEPDFSLASKETVSAECRPTQEPLQLSSRVNPLEMFHHVESLDESLEEENVRIVFTLSKTIL